MGCGMSQPAFPPTVSAPTSSSPPNAPVSQYPPPPHKPRHDSLISEKIGSPPPTRPICQTKAPELHNAAPQAPTPTVSKTTTCNFNHPSFYKEVYRVPIPPISQHPAYTTKEPDSLSGPTREPTSSTCDMCRKPLISATTGSVKNDCPACGAKDMSLDGAEY